ncbi:rod shape-determining protein [bacterium]|nr:rod shape-determining protein [bacterium]
MFLKKIGIDLGTVNTLIFLPKRGIILNEPSVVALNKQGKILAVGTRARKMLGKAPEEIMVCRPLLEGVIADYKATQAMLSYFIKKVSGRLCLRKPEVMVTVPVGITSTERRAIIESILSAGAKNAYLIKDPVAAAIGADIKITSAQGNMIVDIGGGSTDVAVISLGGIVSSACLRIAGNRLDRAIQEYIKKRHNLAIGEKTAEKIKITIGSAVILEKELIRKVQGRDLLSGLPKIIQVASGEITLSIRENLYDMIKTIKNVLRDTPPELISDIIDKGVVLTGGGALLKNIDKLISENIGVPCYVAQESLLCAAKGLGQALDSLETYKQSLLSR